MPAKIIAMKMYCKRDNFSFKNILERMKETITVPEPIMTAAMPCPSDNANKYVA